MNFGRRAEPTSHKRKGKGASGDATPAPPTLKSKTAKVLAHSSQNNCCVQGISLGPACLKAAVQKFDAVFAAVRAINGLSPAERAAVRRKDVAPLVDELIEWMKRERAKLSNNNAVARAMDYMLKRIDAFTRFLDNGRICLSNNAAERALRGIALGRKAWLFAGIAFALRLFHCFLGAEPKKASCRAHSAGNG
jgi:hypothetical protein